MSSVDDLYAEWFGPQKGEGLYAYMQRKQKEHEEWVKNQPPLTMKQLLERLSELSDAQRKDPMHGKIQFSGAAVLSLDDKWFLSVVRSKNAVVFCGTDVAKAIEERAHKLGYNIDGTKYTPL